MKKPSLRSCWQWYAVKLLYESIITGKPSPETIDSNYTDEFKTNEEVILLVKAQSFDHAYKIVKKKAKDNEISYYNPYDQSVSWKFIDSIDCFHLFDESFKTGTELYSRHIRVPKSINKDEVISRLYPETVEEETPDYNWTLRNRDFNKKPSKES